MPEEILVAGLEIIGGWEPDELRVTPIPVSPDNELDVRSEADVPVDIPVSELAPGSLTRKEVGYALQNEWHLGVKNPN